MTLALSSLAPAVLAATAGGFPFGEVEMDWLVPRSWPEYACLIVVVAILGLFVRDALLRWLEARDDEYF